MNININADDPFGHNWQMAVLLPHENILIGLNVKKKPKNNLANNSELGRMFLLFWAFLKLF